MRAPGGHHHRCPRVQAVPLGEEVVEEEVGVDAVVQPRPGVADGQRVIRQPCDGGVPQGVEPAPPEVERRGGCPVPFGGHADVEVAGQGRARCHGLCPQCGPPGGRASRGQLHAVSAPPGDGQQREACGQRDDPAPGPRVVVGAHLALDRLGAEVGQRTRPPAARPPEHHLGRAAGLARVGQPHHHPSLVDRGAVPALEDAGRAGTGEVGQPVALALPLQGPEWDGLAVDDQDRLDQATPAGAPSRLDQSQCALDQGTERVDRAVLLADLRERDP